MNGDKHYNLTVTDDNGKSLTTTNVSTKHPDEIVRLMTLAGLAQAQAAQPPVEQEPSCGCQDDGAVEIVGSVEEAEYEPTGPQEFDLDDFSKKTADSISRQRKRIQPSQGDNPLMYSLDEDDIYESLLSELTKLEEAQSMSDALKNSLAKAEPGSKLDKKIKAHNNSVRYGNGDNKDDSSILKKAPTGYHFDKKGYIRLGEGKAISEKAKNPYAIGMAAAKKEANDEPPLKKSTINKAHKIAKSIKADESSQKKSEKLDELSPQTMTNYISKASDATGHRKLPLKKVDNRYAGVARASNKLDRVAKGLKKGDFVTYAGKLYRIFGFTGNLLNVGEYLGPDSYGGTTELHISKVRKADAPMNEAPLLGPQGKIHRAASADQSDREYIEQRQFKDKWKSENPGKPWPGYEKAGFKSRYYKSESANQKKN